MERNVQEVIDDEESNEHMQSRVRGTFLLLVSVTSIENRSLTKNV